jgi:Uncharacterized alpha/beta hydrolase domain (DUF2235)
MSKNIVLFIDGTWNAPDDKDPKRNTNVVQLCEAAVKSPSQLVLYLRGVGTDQAADPDHPGVLERTEHFLKTKRVKSRDTEPATGSRKPTSSSPGTMKTATGYIFSDSVAARVCGTLPGRIR